MFVLADVTAAAAVIDEVGIKKSIFFQEERLIITNYWLMEEIFMINQLTTW